MKNPTEELLQLRNDIEQSQQDLIRDFLKIKCPIQKAPIEREDTFENKIENLQKRSHGTDELFTHPHE